MRKNKNPQNGLTLIEALVAVAILGVAMTPAVMLATSALRIARAIENNMVAAGLAQEGIEVVRGIRDGNWFQGNAFETDLTSCAPPDGCRVSWNSGSAAPGAVPPTHAIGTNPVLYVDPGYGRYHYEDISPVSGSPPSIFSRRITIEPKSQGGVVVELAVISEVTWTERSVARSLKVEDHLFDWK